MRHEFPPEYQCGDLRISPALGTITSAGGASVRLGPVNMRVLATLLARPGQVVSRAELFESVWKNQVVSEDALTRCVSDIRADLRAVSDYDEWIETLPKRGYRWLAEARAIDASDQPADPSVDASGKDPSEKGRSMPRRAPLSRRLMAMALRGAAYAAGAAVMAVMLVWVADRMTGERTVVIAVLPTAAGPELGEDAAELDLALTTFLLQIDNVRVLSPSAIESRPANPFPFFALEFGARWLIETDLRKAGGATTLTLTVADARTGITESQTSQKISIATELGSEAAPPAFETLSRFIASEFNE